MGRRCVADASPFRFIASQFGWVLSCAALSGSADLGQPASLADPARLERRAGTRRGLVRHAGGYVMQPRVLPQGPASGQSGVISSIAWSR
jgi:hypothetical protein